MSNDSSNLDKVPPEGAQKAASAAKWPKPLVALALAVILFLGGQVFSAIVVAVLTAVTGESSSVDTAKATLFGSPVLLQFAYALAAYGSMLAALAYFMRRRGLGWPDLGLKRPRISDAGWAILAFVVYITVYALLVSVISPLVPGLDVDQRQDTGFDGVSGLVPLVLVGLTLVVLAPFVEEVLMRGFFFGSLRKRLPFWLAALVVSAIFGSFHLWGGEADAGLLWIAAIDTFLLSFALCYLREKTGRLWASIALHMVKNGIAFTYLFIIAG